MKIGIVSDTHNNLRNVQRIVELFNASGVERVIHTGDITQAKTLDVFAHLNAPLYGVFGNNDEGERESLEAAVRSPRLHLSKATIPARTGMSARIMVVHDPLEFEGHLDSSRMILHCTAIPICTATNKPATGDFQPGRVRGSDARLQRDRRARPRGSDRSNCCDFERTGLHQPRSRALTPPTELYCSRCNSDSIRAALAPRSLRPTRDTLRASTIHSTTSGIPHTDHHVVLEAEPEGGVGCFHNAGISIHGDDLEPHAGQHIYHGSLWPHRDPSKGPADFTAGYASCCTAASFSRSYSSGLDSSPRNATTASNLRWIVNVGRDVVDLGQRKAATRLHEHDADDQPADHHTREQDGRISAVAAFFRYHQRDQTHQHPNRPPAGCQPESASEGRSEIPRYPDPGTDGPEHQQHHGHHRYRSVSPAPTRISPIPPCSRSLSLFKLPIRFRCRFSGRWWSHHPRRNSARW